MLMRGERCELQQLVQVQELGVGGMYAVHPKIHHEHLGGLSSISSTRKQSVSLPSPHISH